jgi:hypothetical protein
MRCLSRTVLAFGALALLAPAAPSQQSPGGPFSGGGVWVMLLNKDVQKELKLGDEQVTKAAKVSQDVVQKHREELTRLTGPGAALHGDEAQLKKQVKLSRMVTDEVVEGMGDSLKPEQAKRFKQLALQQNIQLSGAGVFQDSEVDKALKLTDKQKEQLKGLTEDLQKKQQSAVKDAKGNYQEMFKMLGTVNKESVEGVVKTLTEDQKKTWKDLLGEPFEFKTGPAPVPPPKPSGTK